MRSRALKSGSTDREKVRSIHLFFFALENFLRFGHRDFRDVGHFASHWNSRFYFGAGSEEVKGSGRLTAVNILLQKDALDDEELRELNARGAPTRQPAVIPQEFAQETTLMANAEAALIALRRDSPSVTVLADDEWSAENVTGE
ncbi:hypothetical protein Tc00.1047053508577.50 [Trypanosoma cruzi]|uniref:Uncharacterized protein n=1 Tax=Trypanosoma cruzi (strain CL Brener) TaxID=353153 RepID=Q4DPC7_TRYCC|nr:hypothetical protein Tc00.1047053508577.50 [Trypanosoma cruzi]EAN94370.1 hypothetical protein Tc00.1047053508577.50 [Trypanosoma cruzi]|eukprot:XP_816221.1 hypothetical protein [Trypanosoma cruzi strain CL Brener]